MTRDEEIEAQRAQQLLEDPLLQRLFAEEYKAAVAELLTVRDATPEADAKRRELIDRANTINGALGRLDRLVRVKQQAIRPRPQVA